MISAHKDDDLAAIERRFPAGRYVLVDDKIRILTAFKQAWGARVTTVFPRQGQFAADRKTVDAHPPADVSVERIGALLDGPTLADLAGA